MADTIVRLLSLQERSAYFAGLEAAARRLPIADRCEYVFPPPPRSTSTGVRCYLPLGHAGACGFVLSPEAPWNRAPRAG